MKFGDYGQSRFRWNAIVFSSHSSELKTARLPIPYYHSPFTPPQPPPPPSSSRDETSRALVFFVRFTPACFSESLLSHSSFAPGNGKKEILVLLNMKKIRKFSRSVVLETASHKVSQQIGHFQVPKNLTFKARLSAKPFIWKWLLIMMQIKLINFSQQRFRT